MVLELLPDPLKVFLIVLSIPSLTGLLILFVQYINLWSTADGTKEQLKDSHETIRLMDSTISKYTTEMADLKKRLADQEIELISLRAERYRHRRLRHSISRSLNCVLTDIAQEDERSE
jgi:septal ring factor EnvC (AmiA/AmiB activator)